ELLEIKLPTATRWSIEDEWNKKREEMKENIKKGILERAHTEHAEQLQEAASNLILSLLHSSESVPAATMQEVKSLVDSIEKIYKIFGDLNIIEKQADKVELEHKGSIKHESRYEEHLSKFSEMLDQV